MNDKYVCQRHNYYKNLMKYVHLLPLHEKITEFNNMVDFYTNRKYQCRYVKLKYAAINNLKNVRKEILLQSLNV